MRTLALSGLKHVYGIVALGQTYHISINILMKLTTKSEFLLGWMRLELDNYETCTVESTLSNNKSMMYKVRKMIARKKGRNDLY